MFACLMQIFYHVHKHLVDGLYPLAEDLSRLVTSGRFPIRSPMDRLDAIDALNAILRAKIKIRMEDEDKNLNLIQVESPFTYQPLYTLRPRLYSSLILMSFHS